MKTPRQKPKEKRETSVFATNYIYIGDQGEVFASSDEPTPEDLDFATRGMVSIVRMKDGQVLGREGEWKTPVEGILTASEKPRSRQFHMAP